MVSAFSWCCHSVGCYKSKWVTLLLPWYQARQWRQATTVVMDSLVRDGLKKKKKKAGFSVRMSLVKRKSWTFAMSLDYSVQWNRKCTQSTSATIQPPWWSQGKAPVQLFELWTELTALYMEHSFYSKRQLETLLIQTWLLGRCFLENDPGELVTPKQLPVFVPLSF